MKAPATPASLARERAFAARPAKTPVLGIEQAGKGDVRIRVMLAPKAWLRFLGAPRQVERSFVLDPLGLDVYNACNGATTVADIATGFARRHQVSVAEAERSVTTFLRILMKKGLVVMAMEKPS